jgi:initiation factor 1A
MVKNTNGGKGAKSLARKLSTNDDHDSRLRLPDNHLEQFAVVTKMLGNGMCSVTTQNNISLICHIRSKFRGRSKRNNLVSVHSIVLVGLRDWENIPKNCDLLHIYNDSHFHLLHNYPSLLSIIPNYENHDNDFLFNNESLDEQTSNHVFINTSNTNDDDDIPIDDI